MVKKGGTNAILHGQGGELFKNDTLVERDFFQLNTNPQQGIYDTFQQPDFFVSGPVWLPKVYNGKNKTFFFDCGSYHVDSSSNPSSDSTPTAAEIGGNTSQFSNVLYDPASTSGSFSTSNLSRAPFPGNVIPQNRFSSMWNGIMANNPFAPPQSGAGSITPTGPSGNIVASGTGQLLQPDEPGPHRSQFHLKAAPDGHLLVGRSASATEQCQYHLCSLRSIPGADLHGAEYGAHRVHGHGLAPHSSVKPASARYRRTQNPQARPAARVTNLRSISSSRTFPPTSTSIPSTLDCRKATTAVRNLGWAR